MNNEAIEMKEDKYLNRYLFSEYANFENSVAKNKYINMWMERCVKRYRKNYSIHIQEIAKLSEMVTFSFLLKKIFTNPE